MGKRPKGGGLDLSLIISEIEMDILIKQLNIPQDLLIYIPFLLDNHSIPDQLNSPKFSKRNDFVFVGNFLHPPNADAVLFLKTKIWPHIHKKLPQASLHIYGAYPKPSGTIADPDLYFNWLSCLLRGSHKSVV